MTKKDKENYVVHIRTLKQALMHGLKLKKVHKILSLIKNMAKNEKEKRQKTRQKTILKKTFLSL